MPILTANCRMVSSPGANGFGTPPLPTQKHKTSWQLYYNPHGEAMNKDRYIFTVLKIPAGRSDAVSIEPLFGTYDTTEVEELRQFLLEQNAGFRRSGHSRHARPVKVIHVDQKEHERWVTTPGRNGLTSKPVVRGQVFWSAVEASGWLGLRHNEVAIVLSHCAATGEKQVTVRGVTLACADEK